jgi:hypothetical protein
MSYEYEPCQAEAVSPLVDDVIERIKDEIEQGDLTALDEMLRFVPRHILIGYLPEDQWNKHLGERNGTN